MAATVINGYADELQLFVESNERMNPVEGPICRLQVIPFTLTFASEASGHDVALCILPKGCRIISGGVAADGALANTAQISIGLAGRDGTGFIDAANSVSDSVTFFKAAATQSTTFVGFALTTALGYGYQTQKECWLTLTTSVGTVAVEVLKGHVLVAFP